MVVAETSELIPILFQDEHLLVVHKKSGMLVHKGMGASSNEIFLLQALRDQIGQWVYPLHRLDRPTSGLVVFALDPETNRLLQESWQDGKVHKTYQAIVRGWFDLNNGICQENLVNPENQDAQIAQTLWKKLDQCLVPHPVGKYPTARYSLLEVHPLTGRWHQIRRHLNGMTHPILGDTTHGDRHHNHFISKEFGWNRLLLAATEIEFPHPHNHEIIRVNDHFENGLVSYWNQLKVFKA